MAELGLWGFSLPPLPGMGSLKAQPVFRWREGALQTVSPRNRVCLDLWDV